MLKKIEYYIYYLIDPRTNIVFYVGKGCRNRMYNHVREVRMLIEEGKGPNESSNSHRFKVIRKILSLGLKVKYKKVYITYDEKEAYAKEKEEIDKIGLENLTNVYEGGEGVSSGEHHPMYGRRGKRHHNFGKKLSIEARQRMSKAKKGKYIGENNPFYGKKHLEKTRKKMSKNHFDFRGEKNPNFGRKWSEERKKEQSKKLTGKMVGENHPFYGKCHSPETKRKISEARKGKYSGESHPNYGKKWSEEKRKKFSEMRKGSITGENNPMYGKKHSDETKRRISLSRKGKRIGEDHPMFGKKFPEESRRKMSENHADVRGEKNGRAKLTPKDVWLILMWDSKKIKTRKQIRKIYSNLVSPDYIGNILRRKTWKYIDPQKPAPIKIGDEWTQNY